MSKIEKVLATFGKILPELSEPELDRLLAYGEGIAFRVRQEKEMLTAPPVQGAERPSA